MHFICNLSVILSGRKNLKKQVLDGMLVKDNNNIAREHGTVIAKTRNTKDIVTHLKM